MQRFWRGRLSLPSGRSQGWHSWHCAALSWWDRMEKGAGARCPVPQAERGFPALPKAGARPSQRRWRTGSLRRAGSATAKPRRERTSESRLSSADSQNRESSRCRRERRAERARGRSRYPAPRPAPRGARRSRRPGQAGSGAAVTCSIGKTERHLPTEHLSSPLTFTVIRRGLQFQLLSNN